MDTNRTNIKQTGFVFIRVHLWFVLCFFDRVPGFGRARLLPSRVGFSRVVLTEFGLTATETRIPGSETRFVFIRGSHKLKNKKPHGPPGIFIPAAWLLNFQASIFLMAKFLMVAGRDYVAKAHSARQEPRPPESAGASPPETRIHDLPFRFRIMRSDSMLLQSGATR